MTVIEIIVVTVYVSILLEITVFPVPSVASTYQLFYNKNVGNANGLMQRVQSWHPMVKTIFLLLPTTLSVFIYCFPLANILININFEMLGKFPIVQSTLLGITAIFLMLMGRLLSFHAVLKIRRNNSQKNNEFSLKTNGIFSHSRNPILLGMYITYVGIFLLYPYKLLMVGLVVYIGNMHFRVLLEEDFLKHKFGGQFEQYMRVTKRYF